MEINGKRKEQILSEYVEPLYFATCKINNPLSVNNQCDSLSMIPFDFFTYNSAKFTN
jgi:hypothetical protein